MNTSIPVEYEHAFRTRIYLCACLLNKSDTKRQEDCAPRARSTRQECAQAKSVALPKKCVTKLVRNQSCAQIVEASIIYIYVYIHIIVVQNMHMYIYIYI